MFKYNTGSTNFQHQATLAAIASIERGDFKGFTAFQPRVTSRRERLEVREGAVSQMAMGKVLALIQQGVNVTRQTELNIKRDCNRDWDEAWERNQIRDFLQLSFINGAAIGGPVDYRPAWSCVGHRTTTTRRVSRAPRRAAHVAAASASHNDGGGGGSDSSDDGGSDPQPEPHKVALARRGQGAVVVSIKQNSRMEESSGTHCIKCGTVEFFACFFTAKEEAA